MSKTARRPSRERYWMYLLLLTAGAAPLLVAWQDWAAAVRRAHNSASILAWNKAAQGFLGQDFNRRSSSGATITLLEVPPRAGPFAGHSHAAHVETVYEWRPIFSALVGGPYLLRGSATAAVVRDEHGHWMPLLVE